MKSPTLSIIIAVTARFYELPLGAMRSPSRENGVAHPRQVAMYLARRMTPHSLATIALRFDFDHTTVVHAVHRTRERMRGDRHLRNHVGAIRAAILRRTALRMSFDTDALVLAADNAPPHWVRCINPETAETAAPELIRQSASRIAPYVARAKVPA
jgi:hypothetical protein